MDPDRSSGGRCAAAIVVLLFALAAPSCAAPIPAGPSESAAAPSSHDVDALVDIGGRSLHLVCRGSGSPTVVFVSGTRGAADEWTTLLPDAAPGTTATFDAVSEVTRACAYDRPGTTLASGDATDSTPVPQPTTALQSADDLKALLEEAGEEGPYVLVGLSWGGLIAQQFTRSYGDEVTGLVLLDAANEYLRATFSPEQWAAWMAVIAQSRDAAGSEVPAYEPSLRDIGASPPMPRIPIVVMSSDHPWDLQVTPGASTWPGWVAAQADLALALGATHVTETDSGHGLPVEQPALVADAILGVVAEAR
jgi:pimeloyl-ACP methyl ester carboxylesterase